LDKISQERLQNCAKTATSGIFCSGRILLMIAAFLIHEVTTYADLRIATREREGHAGRADGSQLYGDDAPHRDLAGHYAPRGRS
jgi:hypothetical protein